MYFKLLTFFVVLFTFSSLGTILCAQDQNSDKNQVDPIQTKDNQAKDNQEKDNQEKDNQENAYSGLFTPQEIDKLSSVFYLSQTEHYSASIFSGFLAGGAMGLLSSLAFFSNDTNANNRNLIIFSAVASSIGALSGFFLAFSESLYGRQQFNLGRPFLQFQFYSTIGVSLIGLITGAIIYVFNSNKDINFLAKGAGYGALAGTLVGFILYFSLGKHIIMPKNITISSPLDKHGVIISYAF